MSQLSQLEIRKLLEQHSLFSSFKKSLLDEIISKCEIRKYHHNEIIIQQGQVTEESFYLLIAGKAEAFIQDNRGTNYAMSQLSEGDVFGENIMFHEEERASSVQAISTTDVLVIPKKLIDGLMDKDSLAQLLRKLHSQTLKYLTSVNRRAMELLKLQHDMGIFLIDIVVFLSILTILFPFFKTLITKIDVTLIAVLSLLLISFGVLFLISRLYIMKIPLSVIGITTENLKRSLIESFIISAGILLFAGILNAVLIHYYPTFNLKEFLHSGQNLMGQGIYRTRLEVITVGIIYCLYSIFQELLARGALQSTFKQFFTFKHGSLAAIVMASLVSSCTHVFFGLGSVLIVFIPGLFWGWMYERQGNIFGAALSHAMIGVSIFEFVGPF